MKFSITDFFNKCDQVRSFLRIWSHLLKKPLMENFIFRAVLVNKFFESFSHWLAFRLKKDKKYRIKTFPVKQEH